jgi:arabinofuranosyltransferase
MSLSQGGLRRVARALPAVVPVVALGVMGHRQAWVGDDGYINLRVVSQLLEGHGFVFNVGERVEASTSPLWIGVLTLGGLAGAPLAPAAVWLGIALSMLGMIAASLGSAAPARAGSRRLLPFGTVIFASVAASWDYVTSGLENGLSTAWLGLSFWLVMRLALTASLRALVLSSFVVGLGPLVRPDFGIFSLALGSMVLWFARHMGSRRMALGMSVLIAPAFAFQIFRMGYFGALVPNTALAKEAFESRWAQGLHYFTNTFGLYQLAVPLALALLVAVLLREREKRIVAVRIAMSSAGVLHLLYVVRVGGDFMHARLLLPGLFALLAPVAVIDLARARGPVRAAVGASLLALLGWSVYCAGFVRVAAKNEYGIGDERGWHARQARVANPVLLSDYPAFFFHRDGLNIKTAVAAHCPGGLKALEAGDIAGCERIVLLDPTDGWLTPRQTQLPLDPAIDPHVVAVAARRPLGIAAGVVGSHISLIDTYGLADPVAARLEFVQRGRPGHEKQLSSAWLAARFAAPEASVDPGFRAARAALGCGELAELIDATRAPMSWQRFLRNLSSAFSLHRLRIPPDPQAAMEGFCSTR